MTEAAATAPTPASAIAPHPYALTRDLRRVLWIVALYAVAVYLPFLGSSRTLTRHEVFVTQPARQMLADGDWLVPHYTDRVWIQKPPLVHWMTAGLFRLAGGFGEWTARLPAALSAIGLCVLVAALAGRFHGPSAGMLAGLVQATCVYGYMQGRLGEVDMTFVLFLAAAQAVLAWHWGTGSYRLSLRAAALFHVLAGLAVMTKGPLAVVLLGATVLSFCAVRRTIAPLRAVLWTPGTLAFLAIALPWYVAVYLRLDRQDLWTWYYDSIGRAEGDHHLGSQSPLLYLYSVPWLMLPWTIALLLGARQLYQGVVRQPQAILERFLWCWFAAGMVLLSAIAFKHQHYCMPLLPPLSILAGTLLADHAARLGLRVTGIYRTGFAVALVLFGIVGGIIMPWQDGRRLTVAFLREAVPQVPAEAPLYVVGLGQSAAYPYIEHKCVYLSRLDDIRQAIRGSSGRSIWLLTTREMIPTAEHNGLHFQEAAAEAPRRSSRPRKPWCWGIYSCRGRGSSSRSVLPAIRSKSRSAARRG